LYEYYFLFQILVLLVVEIAGLPRKSLKIVNKSAIW